MNGDNFVRLYDNCLDQESCDKMIDEFKEAEKASKMYSDDEPSILRKDTHFNLYDRNPNLNEEFNSLLDVYVAKYCDDFPVLKGCSISSFCNKMQKTELSGGYHNWHCENTSMVTSSRVLTWLFYFNDVTEGGETELLHYSIRVKPKAGRLIIFPAYFTHTHRGNPPISNNKYIATGWYHLS